MSRSVLPSRRSLRAAVVAAAVGAVCAPLAFSAAADADSSSSSPDSGRATYRPSSPPLVMWPLGGHRGRDLGSSNRRKAAAIKAGCGTRVLSATPGIAVVSPSSYYGAHMVRVVTSYGRLVFTYGFMSGARVKNRQIIQAGQQLGSVGHAGQAHGCKLGFGVAGRGGHRHYNASHWLASHVGHQLPTSTLFNDRGFTLATFNTLGASHTPSGRYPGYQWRTIRQVDYLGSLGVDVVGLQEFQAKQKTVFMARAKGTYGIYPSASGADTENSIIWRNSTMQFVNGTTMDVPYFQGHIRHMPVILLRERASGRLAYFINVHNPATLKQYGDASKWRAKAIAIERAKVIQLRKSGLPVFLTGDLNDRAPAFCGLTARVLMIAPNSVPSYRCAMPAGSRIDWILTAGPARFSRYTMTWAPKQRRLTDHPILYTEAHLAPRGW